MKPAVKVLLAVVSVLAALYLLKMLSSRSGFLPSGQDYEMVPSSQPFVVSNVPLVVSAPKIISATPQQMQWNSMSVAPMDDAQYNDKGTYP
jgi:hypothetical protein